MSLVTVRTASIRRALKTERRAATLMAFLAEDVMAMIVKAKFKNQNAKLQLKIQNGQTETITKNRKKRKFLVFGFLCLKNF